MTENRFISQLERAADAIADVPLDELQLLLRRAALRLRDRPEPPKGKSQREIVARTLCRSEGNPENTMFQGRPMWESYLAQADAVLEALRPTGT